MIALQWAKQANCNHMNKEIISSLRLDLIGPTQILSERYVSYPIINITGSPLPSDFKRQPPSDFSGEFKGVGPTAPIAPNLSFSNQLGLIFQLNEYWVHLEHWGWVYLDNSPRNKFEAWSPIWGKMTWDMKSEKMIAEDPTKIGDNWRQRHIICN